MYRNTRYDRLDFTALGLAPPFPTTGYPITASGENLMRGGAKFYVNGNHTAPQVFGSAWGSDSRVEVDAHLDNLVRSGVNMIGLTGHEAHGRVKSGTLAGRQVGCFELGYEFVGVYGRTWTVGERCWTKDGSDIRRVYECITGGVGASSGTGPTGTGADITSNVAHFKYLHVAGSVYSEEWFAGNPTLGSAGFDYFMDACRRRGIYVTIRFNNWDLVISGRTGYPLNGGGNLSAYFGCWAFDGEYSTPTVRTYMRNHISVFLDRVNTVNGLRYGNDHTLAIINPWNEMGHAYWYFNTTSTSSPSGNTFDRMAFQGSSTSSADPANPTALYVAAWDSKFAAWYTATFGTTPASDYGKANTLPCNGYTGAMGSNVAARDAYRVGATGNDYAWRKRVNRFLRETESTMVSGMQTWLRTKSSHILHLPGQSSWMFPTSLNAGDLCAPHYYLNPSTTSSNTFTATGKATGGGGASWAANVLTVLLKGTGATGPDSQHPLSTGQYVRVTAGGMSSEVVGPITISSSTDFTAPRVGDPGGLATPVDCTVILPTYDDTYNEWQAEPAGDTAATRTHVVLAGSSAEVNSDVTAGSGGWAGSNNYGAMTGTRSGQVWGKPRITTELGNRAICPPSSSIFHVSYSLFDLLQGGSGGMLFSWLARPAVSAPGELSIGGNGSSFLSMQLVALMARYITPFPTEDATQVTTDDIDDWYSKKNTTDLYAGNGAGWPSFVDLTTGSVTTGLDNQYHAFMHSRLRTKIAASTVKTDVTYTHGSAGWTHPELNSASTGRLYHQRNIGTVVYENSKICLMFGRFRDSTDSTETAQMSLKAIDGFYWTGLVAWVSLDGSDLGVGRSALFHWMYARDASQQFRRHAMSGRNQYVEMLDGDSGSAAEPQPGVVMRNGLRVKLTMPAAQTARVIERYGSLRSHGAHYKSGALWINPSRPLIVLG
jgi:hypothetical protein